MASAFDKLCRFLDQEKRLILQGDLNRIVERLDDRSSAIARWANDNPSDAEIVQIRSRLERSQTLMEAAREGLQSAIQSFTEIKLLAANFASYSPTCGRVLTPVGQSKRLNHKS